MRNATACKACRTRKQRCRVTGPSSGPCNFCFHRNTECSLGSSDAFRPPHELGCAPRTRELRQRSMQDAMCPTLPPQDACLELLGVYFSTLHHTQNSLFHRQSFMAAYEQGKVAQILLFGIFALTARFSDHPYFQGTDRWKRGIEWGHAARRMLNVQAMKACIETLQACHLLASLAAAEGDSLEESLYSSLANRIVQHLDLPNRLSLDPLQRELELRVWWTIYMMDVWSCTGLNIPRTLPFNPSSLWPVEEDTFEKMCLNQPDDTDTMDNSHPLRRKCMWGQMVPLTYLKGQIHDLNQAMLKQADALDTWCLGSIAEIAAGLDKWVQALPSQLRDTRENLASHSTNGQGHVFVALHVGYHYHALLLFYRFLHSHPKTTTLGQHHFYYAQRCKRHAAAISKLVWTSYHDFSCKCVWLLISHVLVTSSTVHLHTLLLDQHDAAVAEARTYLEQNFQMLTLLRAFWPWLEQAMQRLKAFQEACLRANHPGDVFRMNSWLSKFLYEHAVTIGADKAKVVDFLDTNSWESMSPQSAETATG